MPEIRIREATDADLPGVLAVYAQPELDDGKVLPIDEARRRHHGFRRYPDYRLYVALLGDRVVGTFALLIMDNLAHDGRPSGVVEDVGVLPEAQGSGVGRAMMSFALERCRERGCYKLMLSSNARREKAHRFYEELGFERHGYSFRVDL